MLNNRIKYSINENWFLSSINLFMDRVVRETWQLVKNLSEGFWALDSVAYIFSSNNRSDNKLMLSL